ncbi:MAG: PP2C family protein-serine/threonine phosphatase [Clostridia bacterium]|nr:PP2C family protein-serine/threonine phosphatase [Clostridia bacterium]
MLEAHIAMVKTSKYASSESGDTVEMVERARGGFSIILSDGQGSGRSAKTTSAMVVNKAVALLADGARDGAVARAVHDFLYAAKHGKVSATLTIISVDLQTKTLLVSRNSHTPVFVLNRRDGRIFTKEVSPIGVHRVMKPEITELPLEEGTIVVTFSDGILDAGKRKGQQMSYDDMLQVIEGFAPSEVEHLAQSLLSHALRLDDNRPADDITVVAVAIDEQQTEPKIRRMHVTFPF